jgi:lipopolysaccharide transport system ATP-binding protein
MSDSIIRVENLGKKYIIDHQQAERYTALRDVIANSAKSLLRPFQTVNSQLSTLNSPHEEFWALKDVSFEIKQGDRVGIIGRNGAGKSTLLKILSRITEPTTGRITINGRVASLLEVGTGFHPELTGRENIFLNGAILGMGKEEIKRKFDEIVAFAEVEKFLDTPVKRYSSGMYVRLAFAVAAHLEPEILIIDEVLAVGDLRFQKKCLGKMQDVSEREGRTVLFVSHGMATVRKLCSRALLLEGGLIKIDGDVNEGIDCYLQNDLTSNSFQKKLDYKKPCVVEVSICDAYETTVETINGKDKYHLRLKVFSNGATELAFGFTLFNSEDIGIISGLTSDYIEGIPSGLSEMVIALPTHLLHPGQYRVEGALADRTGIYEQSECFATFICLRDEYFYLRGGQSKGMVRFSSPWKLTSVEPLAIA